MASQVDARALPQTEPLTESNGGRGVGAWSLWRARCMDDVAEVGARETAGAGKGVEDNGGVGKNRVSGRYFMYIAFR